jgi:hypothetical protein
VGVLRGYGVLVVVRVVEGMLLLVPAVRGCVSVGVEATSARTELGEGRLPRPVVLVLMVSVHCLSKCVGTYKQQRHEERSREV